jgi:phage FluMu gp28-like protein
MDKKPVSAFIEEHFELEPGIGMKLYDFQKNIIDSGAKFRIINKARQLGISSACSWEALAYAILVPNSTHLFISVSERQAMELLNVYVKRVLDNLRKKFHINVLEETKTHIKLDNGSRIISLPNNPNTVQGIRAHRIYIDEYSLFKNDREMLEAILPSISHGGTVTLISRPFGKRGEFYRIYNEAKKGVNEFVLFEIPYTELKDPTYQAMIEKIRNTLDEITFRESYCCEFIDEATSYFPYDMLIQCVDDNLTTPKPGMRLKFGIDFGRKQNSTVITIVEVNDKMNYIREIKEFTGVPYTTQLAFISRKIEDLKPEKVNVDEFGVGVRLFEELRAKHGSVINPIQLTTATKSKMISDLRIIFEDKRIRIPRNDKLMQQLHALVRTVSGGYERWEPGNTEEFGKHDDFVWSLVMAVSSKTGVQIKYFKTGEISRKPMDFNNILREGFERDIEE